MAKAKLGNPFIAEISSGQAAPQNQTAFSTKGIPFIRAGSLAGIAYCNGILKNWSQKGYRTPKDLENEISNITQSKRNIDSQDDLIIKNITNVPVFDD